MSEFDAISARLSEHNVKDAEIDALLSHARALLSSHSGDSVSVGKYQNVVAAGLAKKGNKVIDYNNPDKESDPAKGLADINKKEHNFAVEREATAYLKETLPMASDLKRKKDSGITLSSEENDVLEATLKSYRKISGLYPHKAKEITNNMEERNMERTNANVRTMARGERTY